MSAHEKKLKKQEEQPENLKKRPRDLHGYLEDLSGVEVDELYQTDKWACQSAFRALHPLAKQIVLRILFLPTTSAPSSSPYPSPAAPTTTTTISSSETPLEKAFNQIYKMHLARPVRVSNNNKIQLNEIFQKQMRGMLCSPPAKPWLEITENSTNVGRFHRFSAGEVELIGKEAWETILQCLLRAMRSFPVSYTSPLPLQLLVRCGLLEPIHPTIIQEEIEGDEDDAVFYSHSIPKEKRGRGVGGGGVLEYKISEIGFRFLLRKTVVQMWMLVYCYLEFAEDYHESLPGAKVKLTALSILFQLSVTSAGGCYLFPTSEVSPVSIDILHSLQELGLIVLSIGDDGAYYVFPTVASIALTNCDTSVLNDPSSVTKDPIPYKQPPKHKKKHNNNNNNNNYQRDQEAPSHLVVESNYRVYAYDHTSLVLDVLSLFTEIKYTLPNLAVCLLTRESVRKGLDYGLTARLILEYLTASAHPVMLRNQRAGETMYEKSIIPQTIQDQIRLWEIETMRVSFQAGRLYRSFTNLNQFKSVLEEVKRHGGVLWKDEKRMMMVVSAEAHQEMGDYMQKFQ